MHLCSMCAHECMAARGSSVGFVHTGTLHEACFTMLGLKEVLSPSMVHVKEVKDWPGSTVCQRLPHVCTC